MPNQPQQIDIFGRIEPLKKVPQKIKPPPIREVMYFIYLTGTYDGQSAMYLSKKEHRCVRCTKDKADRYTAKECRAIMRNSRAYSYHTV